MRWVASGSGSLGRFSELRGAGVGGSGSGCGGCCVSGRNTKFGLAGRAKSTVLPGGTVSSSEDDSRSLSVGEASRTVPLGGMRKSLPRLAAGDGVLLVGPVLTLVDREVVGLVVGLVIVFFTLGINL